MCKVFGNKSNVGDWIIREGSLNILKEVFSSSDETHIVSELAKRKFQVGGPGVIRDSYERFYKNNEVLGLLGVGAYVYPYNTASSLRFTTKTQTFFKNLNTIYVRDHFSRDALLKVGVDAPMLGCPSFGNLAYDQPHTSNSYVALTTPARPEFLHAFRDLVKFFHKNKLKIKFIFNSGTLKTPFMSSKLKLFVDIANEFGEIVDCEGDLSLFAKTINECTFHVGFRLHGHVYALANNIPSVLLAEDSRSVGLAGILNSTYIAPVHKLDIVAGSWLMNIPQKVQARLNKPSLNLHDEIIELCIRDATTNLQNSRDLMAFYRKQQTDYLSQIITK